MNCFLLLPKERAWDFCAILISLYREKVRGKCTGSDLTLLGRNQVLDSAWHQEVFGIGKTKIQMHYNKALLVG